VLYVATIAVAALVFGAALDALAGVLPVPVVEGHAHRVLPEPVLVAGGGVLVVFLAWSVWRWVRRRLKRAAEPAAAEHAAERS